MTKQNVEDTRILRIKNEILSKIRFKNAKVTKEKISLTPRNLKSMHYKTRY